MIVNAIQGVTDTLCNTPTPVGIVVSSSFRVSFGTVALPTSSVAVRAEQLSLVFVATDEDDQRIRGVSYLFLISLCSFIMILFSLISVVVFLLL